MGEIPLAPGLWKPDWGADWRNEANSGAAGWRWPPGFAV